MIVNALLVDGHRHRRAALAHVLMDRGVAVLEMDDSLSALSALGRADFGVMVVAQEKRLLSLRGLCMVARKRHPHISIVVMQDPGMPDANLRETAGTAVTEVPGDQAPEVLGAAVMAALATAAPVADPVLATATAAPQSSAPPPPRAPADIPAAVPLPVPAAVDATPPLESPADMVIHWAFEDAPAPAVAMALFAQELTGWMQVQQSGAADGVYYFLRGEPVGAELPDGDAGLWDRLLAGGYFPPGTPRPALDEGQLLPEVAQQLSGDALHDFLRTTVKDLLLALLRTEAGAATFTEDRSFLDVTPLLKFNPVGLVVDACRQIFPPDAVMRESEALSGHYVHPMPGLGAASRKMEPFLRGASAAALITGQTTLLDFCTQSHLGPLMGTLMALVMARMRLVRMEEEPYVSGRSSVTLTTALPARPEPVTGRVEVAEADAEAAAEVDASVRNEVFTTYTRIKTLTVPRYVLGVSAHAGLGEIEAAYRTMSQRVDAWGIHEGALAARVAEIRNKMDAALAALRLSEVDGGADNPF